MPVPTDVVLFDLGGVLVELTGVPTMGTWAAIDVDDELWHRWLTCPWVRRFERGECSADDFARGMVDSWRLPVAPDVFLESFRIWPRGLFPGARELLEALAPGLERACLSNSNELHWPRARDEMELGTLLDRHFVSHEIGMVKPDAEIFEHVVESLARPPDRILFLDDNQLNVEAARAAGLSAERTLGVESARRALAERGLLA